MNIAYITGTGTVAINGVASPLAGSLVGLVANRRVKVYSITVQGTGGAGTVTVHNTASATGTGTVGVFRTGGTAVIPVDLAGGELNSGMRVVPSGTTGGLVTIVTFE